MILSALNVLRLPQFEHWMLCSVVSAVPGIVGSNSETTLIVEPHSQVHVEVISTAKWYRAGLDQNLKAKLIFV
jgi:hypothetical protein